MRTRFSGLFIGAAVLMAAPMTAFAEAPIPRALQVDMNGEVGVFASGAPVHYLYAGGSLRVVLAGTSPYTLRTDRETGKTAWARRGLAVETELRSGALYGFEADKSAPADECVSVYVGTESVQGGTVGLRGFYAVSQKRVFARVFGSVRAGVMRSAWFAGQPANDPAPRPAAGAATPSAPAIGTIRTLDAKFGFELGGQRSFFVMTSGLHTYTGKHVDTGFGMAMSMGLGRRF